MFTRISRSVSAIVIGAAIAVAAPGGAALALDANQVLKEKKKSHDDVWEKFFSFRKNGKSKEAASTLEYAAEQGDHAAQWKLGKMYETGDGVAKDPAAAVRFYSKIVENYSDAAISGSKSAIAPLPIRWNSGRPPKGVYLGPS